MSSPLPQKHSFEKVWQQYVRRSACRASHRSLYIDLHLVHEVTSPQAFDGLRMARPQAAAAPTVPSPRSTTTCPRSSAFRIGSISSVKSPRSRSKPCVATARTSASSFIDVQSPEQGIVHIIGPELGLTKPGMTIVCGDSHTSTHGAFGALAFGIGTSEVEHVIQL